MVDFILNWAFIDSLCFCPVLYLLTSGMSPNLNCPNHFQQGWFKCCRWTQLDPHVDSIDTGLKSSYILTLDWLFPVLPTTCLLIGPSFFHSSMPPYQPFVLPLIPLPFLSVAEYRTPSPLTHPCWYWAWKLPLSSSPLCSRFQQGNR